MDLLKQLWLVAPSSLTVIWVLWIFRKWISERLSQSITHEYTKKLEVLRAENEANRNMINSLRTGPLSNLSSRERLLFEKRLEAAEKVWESKCLLSKALLPVQYSSMMKWDHIKKEQKDGGVNAEKLKLLGETLSGGLSVKNFTETEGVNIQRYRPYIPDDLWSYYGAYSGICLNAVMKMQNLKDGFGLEYFNENPYNEQLKDIFPELSGHIDEYGEGSYSALLSSLSDKILESINNIFSGIEADEIAIKKAKKLLQTVEAVSANSYETNF